MLLRDQNLFIAFIPASGCIYVYKNQYHAMTLPMCKRPITASKEEHYTALVIAIIHATTAKTWLGYQIA